MRERDMPIAKLDSGGAMQDWACFRRRKKGMGRKGVPTGRERRETMQGTCVRIDQRTPEKEVLRKNNDKTKSQGELS